MTGAEQLTGDRQMCQMPHKFEQAGLGKAPFRCTGMSENVYVACQGATPQPGGTCDYCGMGIMYEYHIQSADGKKFKVGCDCVGRLNSNSNVKNTMTQLEIDVKRLKSAHDSQVRNARHARKMEQFPILLAKHETALKAKPHPTQRRAEMGETYYDYVVWYRNCGGNKAAEHALSMLNKLESN